MDRGVWQAIVDAKRGCKELDTTERTHLCVHLHMCVCIVSLYCSFQLMHYL